jgi:rhodanese-related sulfurtransferase
MTQEQLAGLLYDSLYNKILPLADDIKIYPAHGAGSACGKNMMKETVDTLGNQKKTNYALNQPDKNTFIEAVTDGLLPPPGYFKMNAEMNKTGYTVFDTVLDRGMNALTAAGFEAIAETTNALLLDTRDDRDFAKGFIPQSVNIGLNGSFAPWVGTLVADVQQPILLVTDHGKEEETITRLSRVGFDHVLGYLKGGIEAWVKSGKETDRVNRISPEKFAAEMKDRNYKVVDVRKPGEYTAEHIKGADNKPLDYINDWIEEIDPGEHFYLYCGSGYRSMMAASILQARGYRNFSEIEGGFQPITATNVPTTGSI